MPSLDMVAIEVLDSLLSYLRTGQDENENNGSQEFRFGRFEARILRCAVYFVSWRDDAMIC